MRNLKKLCATCVLTLTFALPAFAGDMQAGVTAPPPPRSGTSSVTAQGDMAAGATGEMLGGVTGDMPAGVTGDMGAGGKAIDPASAFLLNLLQSLLALF